MKTINIKGDIVDNDWGRIYDWYGWDYMSPSKMENELQSANGDDVVFLINSNGGSVFDGYDIFNAIKDYKGKTTAKIVGLAASAASFIAMASDKVQACALSQMMIHRASNGNQGNAPSHYANATFLEGVDSTIVKAYTMRNGKTDEEMIELMDKTTWLTPTQALENGIVDEIVNDTVEKPLIINAADDSKQLLISKLFNVDNMDELKMLLNKQIKLGQGVTNSATFDNAKHPKEEKEMTLDELKTQYPDLCNKIAQDATEEAVKNERERIQSINNLSRPGVENQIKEGIENGLSAGEVAINILNAQAAINKAQGEALKNDAEESGVNDVASSPAPQNTDDQEKQSALSNMANIMNGGRK
ncbi:MAG: head maturation protease, ClpP-related [Romboutsia timonensis]